MSLEVSPKPRPAIAVIGFLGRGNCGDEALFQCIFETFSADFDIIACVDYLGACEGWQNWYPYSECLCIHQGNIHFFERPIAGLIVGGGGLGLGFGASQSLVARGAGTPVVLAGTDSTTLDRPQLKHFDEASTQYMRLFDYVALRNAWSVNCARIAGMPVRYGADWALRLKSDESDELARRDDRVLITVREWEIDSFDQAFYISEIRILLASIVDAGLNPVLLPFSPEDETFLEALGIESIAPTERHWWNPRRVKQIIAESRLLVSVGRLHPMILAVSAGVPCIQVAPPLRGGHDGNNFTKMHIMADEFKVPFKTVQEASAMIAAGNISLSDETREAVALANIRLDGMIDDISNLFLPTRAQINSRLVAEVRQKRAQGNFPEAKADYETLFSRVGYLSTHIIDYLDICADGKIMDGVELAILSYINGFGGGDRIDNRHREYFTIYAQRHNLDLVAHILGTNFSK